MASHAADPGGMAAERNAVLEWAAFAFQDWMGARPLWPMSRPACPACSACWAGSPW